MPTLEQLKAEHPEWCWKCGYSVRDIVHNVRPHCDTLAEDEGSPIIAALIAAKLEDEATIAELREELRESKSDTLAWCEQARCAETTLSADAAKEE